MVRLSFCRVAEYQRRGVVHLHAIIRADGPDGTLPPVSADELSVACLRVARSVRVNYPMGEAAWGSEVDVQVLDRDDGRAAKVASYVAKYATKSAESSGVLDRPIQTAEDLDSRQLTPHLRRMVETAWDLGNDPDSPPPPPALRPRSGLRRSVSDKITAVLVHLRQSAGRTGPVA